jgi:hypothetical protein
MLQFAALGTASPAGIARTPDALCTAEHRSGRCVTHGPYCALRITASGPRGQGCVGSDDPFTPLFFAHRDVRESLRRHCSNSSQNVSNLCSGVIEFPVSWSRRNQRSGFFSIRGFSVSCRNSRCRAQKVPAGRKKFPVSLSQGIFTNPLRLGFFRASKELIRSTYAPNSRLFP